MLSLSDHGQKGRAIYLLWDVLRMPPGSEPAHVAAPCALRFVKVGPQADAQEFAAAAIPAPQTSVEVTAHSSQRVSIKQVMSARKDEGKCSHVLCVCVGVADA